MQDDSGAAKMWQANYTITREGLKNGSHLAQLRARALPGFPIRSDEEIEASLNRRSRRTSGEGGCVGVRVWLARSGIPPSNSRRSGSRSFAVGIGASACG